MVSERMTVCGRKKSLSRRPIALHRQMMRLPPGPDPETSANDAANVSPHAGSEGPSIRKLVAILLISLLILIWAGLVATLSPWVGRLPVLVQAAFYLVMGIAWILPLKPLIRWSQTSGVRARASKKH
ncbi:MAG TPA: DUF2842 domain-containing protein [Sphingomicrobium sp.]|nr:DUF2842 domain-containing protein [Sphingomicrobium sp.]